MNPGGAQARSSVNSSALADATRSSELEPARAILVRANAVLDEELEQRGCALYPRRLEE
jgi:hypothetical protein